MVSDLTYAGRKVARFDRIWCPRLFLHAAYVHFEHPNGEKVTIEVPMPYDLAQALTHLNVC